MTSQKINIESLGWHSRWDTEFVPFAAAGMVAGRVTLENRHQFSVYTHQGEYTAEVTGKFHYQTTSAAELPKVGDWVALSVSEAGTQAQIHHVLTRHSKLSRQAAGRKSHEQVLATNVDTVFVVQSANRDFNTRRLERYLTMIYDGNATPTIILNKADLVDDLTPLQAEVEAAAPQVPIFVTSTVTGVGLPDLRAHVTTGVTIAFVGSSGVGKSTLVNQLFGQPVQKTGAVREGDSKGRHTTTQRELFILPDGGLLIDTPGMRELQLWGVDDGLSETFTDIEELTAQCRFSNCTHTSEVGCAILHALNEETLSPARYKSYLKLQQEAAPQKSRKDKARSGKKKRRR